MATDDDTSGFGAGNNVVLTDPWAPPLSRSAPTRADDHSTQDSERYIASLGRMQGELLKIQAVVSRVVWTGTEKMHHAALLQGVMLTVVNRRRTTDGQTDRCNTCDHKFPMVSCSVRPLSWLFVMIALHIALTILVLA